MNSKQRFAAACRAKQVDRPPVWLMRQAGRSLPEYRELKERHTFWELMTTPELAAEVTLQPVRRFGVDAAIIFSDILVVPAALGMEVSFDQGLALTPSIGSIRQISELNTIRVADSLSYVAKALELTSSSLAGETALLGFAGAPFTVASYMIEGGSSKSYSKLKSLMYREPDVYHSLLAVVADATVEYLTMQFECGVDAVQLFDSWASELTPADFRHFVLPYVRRITDQLANRPAPVIYFINGVGNLIDELPDTGADIFGIDWRVSLREVRRRLGENTIVQGNLDPGLLYAAPELISQRTRAMIDETGGIGHIVNLGHGVAPDTPLEGISEFIRATQNWKPTGTKQGQQ